MRAVLRTIHRYLGLLLALPVLVQGVSGTILAFEPLLNDEDTVPPIVETPHGGCANFDRRHRGRRAKRRSARYP